MKHEKIYAQNVLGKMNDISIHIENGAYLRLNDFKKSAKFKSVYQALG
jgi:hypothetical protein